MDTRVQDLELQVFDLQSEVRLMREEVANLAKVASMASDEAQQTALRMDSMEHEWLVWGDVGPQGGPRSTAARTAGRDPSSLGCFPAAPLGAAHADGAHSKRFFASDPSGAPPA